MEPPRGSQRGGVPSLILRARLAERGERHRRIIPKQAQVAVGRHAKLGVQFQRLLVTGHRIVQTPALRQGTAQAVVGLGKVRLQFHGSAIASDRQAGRPCLRKAFPRLLWALASSGFSFRAWW